MDHDARKDTNPHYGERRSTTNEGRVEKADLANETICRVERKEEAKCGHQPTAKVLVFLSAILYLR